MSQLFQKRIEDLELLLVAEQARNQRLREALEFIEIRTRESGDMADHAVNLFAKAALHTDGATEPPINPIDVDRKLIERTERK